LRLTATLSARWWLLLTPAFAALLFPLWPYPYCYRSVAGPSVVWQFGSLFATPNFLRRFLP